MPKRDIGLLAVALLLATSPSLAQNGNDDGSFPNVTPARDSVAPGEIVRTIPAPGPSTDGLAWDGTHLWASDNKTNTIYQLDPADGTVLSSFPAPPGVFPNDLTWDGENLWVAVNDGDTIYEIDTLGNVLSSFPSPSSGPDGLAWDGLSLWHGDFDSSQIYRLDPETGAVLDSYGAISPNGLTYDGSFVWYVDNEPTGFYAVDPADGTLVLACAAPSGNPRGLTFDGTYLWISESLADEIHQVEPCTSTVFSDGFESGDTSSWSTTAGKAGTPLAR